MLRNIDQPFIQISPGWIKAYWEKIEEARIWTELTPNMFIGTNEIQSWYTQLALAIEEKPSIISTCTKLKLMSISYRTFMKQVKGLADQNKIIGKVLSDKGFLIQLCNVLGIDLKLFPSVLFLETKALLNWGLIGFEEAKWLDDSYHRYLYSIMVRYSDNYSFVCRREGTRMVILFVREENKQLDIIRLILDIWQQGCIVNEINLAPSQIIFTEAGKRGYYVKINGMIMSLYHPDLKYISPCLNLLDQQQWKNRYNPTTNTFLNLLYLNQVNKTGIYSNPFSVYNARTPINHNGIFKSPIKFNLATLILYSQHGYLFSREILDRFLTNIDQPLLTLELLYKLNFMFAHYPSPLSIENITEIVLRIINQWKNNLFHSIWNTKGLQAQQMLTMFQYNRDQLTLLLFGNIEDVIFIFTHTYIPNNMFYNDKPTGPKFRFGLLQHSLVRSVFKPFVYPIIQSLWIDKCNVQLTNQVIKLVTDRLSISSFMESIDHIYNGKWRPFESLDMLLNLFLNRKEGEVDLNNVLTLINSAHLSDDEKERFMMNAIRKCTFGHLVNCFQILTIEYSLVQYILGKPTLFIPLPTTRKCINPDTPIDLVSTKALTKVDRTTLSELIFNPPEEEDKARFIIAIGTKDSYVGFTPDELYDQLVEAANGENNLIWTLPCSCPGYGDIIKPDDEDFALANLSFFYHDLDPIYKRLLKLRRSGSYKVKMVVNMCKRLSKSDYILVQKFFYYLLLVVLYVRRWRGPGYHYPKTISQTEVSFNPSIPVQHYIELALDIINNSSKDIRDALSDLRTYGCDYKYPSPTIAIKKSLLTEVLYNMSGKKLGGMCIRDGARNHLFGLVYLLAPLLPLTMPGLNLDEMEGFDLGSEADNGDILSGDEVKDDFKLDFKPIFDLGIPLYIIHPLCDPVLISKMEDIPKVQKYKVSIIGTIIPLSLVTIGVATNDEMEEAFVKDIPLIETTSSSKIRQDGFVLNDDYTITRNGDLVEPGTIVSEGWIANEAGEIYPFHYD